MLCTDIYGVRTGAVALIFVNEITKILVLLQNYFRPRGIKTGASCSRLSAVVGKVFV